MYQQCVRLERTLASQSESGKSTNKQAGLTKNMLIGIDYQFAGKLPFWYTLSLTMETDMCTLRKEHQSHKNV